MQHKRQISVAVRLDLSRSIYLQAVRSEETIRVDNGEVRRQWSEPITNTHLKPNQNVR